MAKNGTSFKSLNDIHENQRKKHEFNLIFSTFLSLLLFSLEVIFIVYGLQGASLLLVKYGEINISIWPSRCVLVLLGLRKLLQIYTDTYTNAEI